MNLVQVSERVLGYWHEIERRFEEPEVVLLFTSPLLPAESLAAVRRAASEVMQARVVKSDEAHPGEEEFRPGDVSMTLVPDGIAIRVAEEPDDFEGLLQGVADALESQGVVGTLDLYEPEAIEPVPDTVDLLECRLRLKGERYPHPRGRKWLWRSDRDALAEGVERGLAWCLENGPQLSLSLVVGLMPPMVLTAQDDVRAYTRQGLEQVGELGVVHLTSVAPDRFRTVAIEPSKGRLTLIEGGASIEDRGWEPSVESLKKELAAAGSWAVYGFIKRGSLRGAAQLGISLDRDWVPVLPWDPLSARGEAFEDEFAPDAFGVQLLGSGYAGRLPTNRSWKHSPAGPGAAVLEDGDLQAWFGQLLGRFGGHSTRPTDPAEIPDVVAKARRDFAAILFTDDLTRTASR